MTGTKTDEIEKKRKRKIYLSFLAQLNLLNSTTIEPIREDKDKSSLQLNTYDDGENTDASDDYEYQPPRTSMKRFSSRTVKSIPQSPENDNRHAEIYHKIQESALLRPWSCTSFYIVTERFRSDAAEFF